MLSAEAASLLAGLRFCDDKGFSLLVVESDSQVLVELVHSKALAKWPFCNTLREIQHFLNKLSGSLSHLYRKANAVTDTLASLNLGIKNIRRH